MNSIGFTITVMGILNLIYLLIGGVATEAYFIGNIMGGLIIMLLERFVFGRGTR